ncbi:MAG: hypothetical protein IT328_27870 [Caldilineaceae bacterium]|nr:hypothetical protein [Caldilineaceae bacterium]
MERKDCTLKVRLTPTEQARAQQLAEITGGNVSDVIRTLLKDARVVVRPRVVEIESEQTAEQALA